MGDDLNVGEVGLDDGLREIGRRLALLLAASGLPDDVKEAYIALLPEMSPEQIDSFMNMLEDQVAGVAEFENAGFVDSLKAVKDKGDNRAAELEEEALAEMGNIESLLDDLEK